MASHRNFVPRPSLALGRYPERQQSKPTRIDELCKGLSSRLKSQLTFSTCRLKHTVDSINKSGKALHKLSDEALADFVSQLRPQLVRVGWQDESIAARAFAAIRELSDRVLGMRHFDCQLQGGWVLLHGQLAEMHTGEGKTLAATLPAATAAMAGVPVHVITTNDYLARRDAAAMRPLYEALGLCVGVVTDDMDTDARRDAYACDITYCTNKQVAFDYLRDRVARGGAQSKLSLDLETIYNSPSHINEPMLRGLCFAIVDEADSVLVDEARTPLVLSRITQEDDPMQFLYSKALELARSLTAGEDFELVESQRRVDLTACGRARLVELTKPMSPVWYAARQREELVQQALSALHLFIRDRDYVVQVDKVLIVDSNTGRILSDRSWERGLHQMIECKEHCEISGKKETLARLSYQQFYRRYIMLAGMTGTAMEVEREVRAVYGLNVVRIPPHKALCRVAMMERVFLCAADARNAIVDSALELSVSGRPVLIGTRSVLKSEELAQQLTESGLVVTVLNARQDAHEAKIIAQAGKRGQITVATNMAGRGTDISIDPDVICSGGLHVIVTERNDSARVDRQLIGRCGRQGDPGSYQCFSSLEDDIPRLRCNPMALKFLSKLACGLPRELPNWLGSRVLNFAQRSLERQHEQQRRRVEQESERLNDLLSFTGRSA